MSYFYRIFSKFYEIAAKKMCKECEGFIKEGDRILDLGCGSAIVGSTFQKHFKGKIFGIDIIDNRIVNIPFQFYDGVSIPFSENYFDVVLINYVLHHCHDPVHILKEAQRTTKEKIIIFEDTPTGFFSNLICKIHGISFNCFFQKNKENGNFKTKKEWKNIFKKLGLKLVFEKKISLICDPILKTVFVLKK